MPLTSFGHFQELMSWRQQGKPELKSLYAFWFGFIPHAANWGIICSYFFYGVTKGDPPVSHFPPLPASPDLGRSRALRACQQHCFDFPQQKRLIDATHT